MVTDFNCDGINYIYGKNVKMCYVDAVTQAMNDVSSRANKNKEIFNINVEVLSNKDNPKTKLGQMYTNFGGLGAAVQAYTVDPLLMNSKQEIVVMTETSFAQKVTNMILYTKKQIFDNLSNNVIHELGHIFDRYFGGNNNTELKEQLRGILTLDIDNESQYNELESKLALYMTNADLSDSDNFKNAYMKDVNKLAKRSDYKKVINKMLEYSPGVYTNTVENPEAVNISDGIDNKEVEASDRERCELFAQLFAFALGYDNCDYNKEVILSTYPNCYREVKQFIKEHLGINCDMDSLPKSSLSCEK